MVGDSTFVRVCGIDEIVGTDTGSTRCALFAVVVRYAVRSTYMHEPSSTERSSSAAESGAGMLSFRSAPHFSDSVRGRVFMARSALPSLTVPVIETVAVSPFTVVAGAVQHVLVSQYLSRSV